MLAVTRTLHRLLKVHRLEPCTLRDLRGDVWQGRMCRCGFVDEDQWTLVESAVQPIRKGDYEQWTARTEREAQHSSRRLKDVRRSAS